MSDILVSVCLITYNHYNYIKDAIEGVLRQEVNFPIELIIADDYSTDGTREVILEYKKKYPSPIKLILQEKNVGPAKNWMDLINSPKSKYIAYFEGDDYWTDCHKLQKQIAFLENNKDYVGCFHNTEERYEDDDNEGSFLYVNYRTARKVTFADLAHFNYIPSCSVVFKNVDLNLPNWFIKLKMGDWPLHLINATKGDFWYIPKVMGVHRLHSKSVWMLQDPKKNEQYILEAYDIMINSNTFNQNQRNILKKAKTVLLKKDNISFRIINRLRKILN